MLMIYSQHLAQGHGIVYNVGQPPVDGATDFLFMVVLAAVSRAGFFVEQSAYGIGLVAHLLTTMLVYETVRRVAATPRWMAIASALFLALGPGLDYIDMGLGTPFFALFAALTWRFALQVAQRQAPSSASALAVAFSGLLLGLARPEGALLALFCLLGLIYVRGLPQTRSVIFTFAAVYGILGGVYFAWHWHHFGYPLPNPFYKKGGGHLYLDGLYESAHSVLVMNAVFLLAIAAGLCFEEARRRAILVLIPIVSFTGIWILLSNERNHAGRFQYALFPIVLMSWPFVLAPFLERWLSERQGLSRTRQAALALPIAAILLLFLAYQHRILHNQVLMRSYHDMNYDIALALEPYHAQGYTIAVDQGGIVPLYSQWHSVDLWGLNNEWIAHHTYVSAAYLDRCEPEVIEIHGPPNLLPQDLKGHPARNISQQWLVMVSVLNQYVKDRHYTLARKFDDASFRSRDSASDTYLYYVRPDFAQSQEIAERLHTLKFPPAWDPSSKQQADSTPHQ